MSRSINYLLVSLTLTTILCTILMMSTYSRPSKERYKNGRFWRAPIVERTRIKQVLTRVPEYYVIEEPVITDDQRFQLDIVELNEGIIFLSPPKFDVEENVQISLKTTPEPINELEKEQNYSIDHLENTKTTSTQESTTSEIESTTDMTTENSSHLENTKTTSTQESATSEIESTTDMTTENSSPSSLDVETTSDSNIGDEQQIVSNEQDDQNLQNTNDYDPCHRDSPGFFDVVWCLGHQAYTYVKNVISNWLGY